MKTAIYTKYGPPEYISLTERPTPTPKPGQILVKIRATTVSSADWRARALAMPPGFRLFGRLTFGILGPRKPVLGMGFAGDVAGIGAGVTRFAIGEAVLGSTGMRMGCHAEYVCVDESASVITKPDAVSYEAGACLSFGPTTALQFLRDKGSIKPGDHVAVVGATGAVGSACVQLARHFGATVTAVCSGANAALAHSLGAETVIDYQTQALGETQARFDIIVDCAGTTRFATHKHLLKPGGRILLILSSLPEMVRSLFNKQLISWVSSENAKDLQVLADLVASGAFTPLIDSHFALDDIVTAHQRVDTGRKRGNVIVLP